MLTFSNFCIKIVWYEYLLIDPCPVVYIGLVNILRFKNKLNGGFFYQALKIRMRTILVNVFSHFVDSVSKKQETSLPLWLTKLTNEMEKPENFVEGINQMIALSGKSREHVSRSVKKYYGITITDYINDLRINYASNLLINTNISIIDICYNCGFQSTSYFYRIFKEKNHVSPSIFRNNCK